MAESYVYPTSSLGAWLPGDCEGDPDAVITQFQSERGNLSGFFQEQIVTDDPLLFFLEATKKEMPDGIGDHLNMPVFSAARPSERDVVNWAAVGHARAGYSPCKVEYKEIPYGSRRVSACLLQDGWKSPVFCKTDLVLKYMWNDQLGAVLSVMRGWTRDIWSMWARHAFGKSVVNTVLSAGLGHPEKVGEYPNCAPTTKIIWDHLEMLYPKIRFANAGLSVDRGTAEQIIFMGDHELKALEDDYFRRIETLGRRAPEIALPELGVVAKRFGKYLIIPLDHPRRYRDRTAGESWEDALIPSFINVDNGEYGVEPIENPDYRNPGVAKYSETIWFNTDAFTWLTPPMAMMSATEYFPATSYAGDFELINPPKGADKCDPKSKNMYFAADFMGGGFSMFPNRARFILSLAHHECPCDVVDVCDGPATNCPPQWSIHKCCESLTAGQLQFVIRGELPESCPAGSALYAVTEKGYAVLIGEVVAQAPYAGDGVVPAGTQVVVAFPEASVEDAVCRDCDPWKFIRCLTPETCLELYGCSDTPLEAPELATCTAAFATDALPTAVDGEDPVIAAPADADDVQVQLQAYLDLNGGGTAVVTYSGAPAYSWTVVITGNDGTADGIVFSYDDAQGNTIEVALSCVAAAE